MLRSMTDLPFSVVFRYASFSVMSSLPLTDERICGSTNVSVGIGVVLSSLPRHPWSAGGSATPAASVQESRRKSRRE
jgi:hypothetical protein